MNNHANNVLLDVMFVLDLVKINVLDVMKIMDFMKVNALNLVL